MDAEPEWENWRIWHITNEWFSEDAIVQWVTVLRSSVDEDCWLKPISSDLIRERIHEFYVVIMQWEFVWCFRIFHPESVWNKALELGSVVSTKKWVWKVIAENAERISGEVWIPIIAVTRWKLEAILQKRWWEIRSHKYKKRRRESCKSKRILEYKPKIG